MNPELPGHDDPGDASTGGTRSHAPGPDLPAIPDQEPESFGDKVNRFARKFAVVLIFVGLAVITYLILANFLPQWWAQRIATRVDGKFSSGIWVGFTLGFACTLIPIVCLALAAVNRRKARNIPSIGFIVLAVLTAIPNLLTLSVVLGNTSGAYRGQYILDVNGPGFRGATLWGAIAAAIVGAAVIYYIVRYRSRGRKLAKAKAAGTPPPKKK